MALRIARFWILEAGRPAGPFAVQELVARPGFGVHSLICIDGEAPGDRRNWRPAWRLKELSSFLSQPGEEPSLVDPAPEAGAEVDENGGLLPPGTVVPVEPSRARTDAPAAPESSEDAFRRFNPALAALAGATLLVTVPIALMTKRPAPFKNPLPELEDAAPKADPWQACLAAGRFEECSASCRKTQNCRVPDAWEVCIAWLGSEQECLDFCSETDQCKPPAEVLRRIRR